MRRRGELSKGMIDRDWPHQVALPSPVVVARFKEIQASASRLGACLRTHAFRREDVDHVVREVRHFRVSAATLSSARSNHAYMKRRGGASL